VLKSVYWKLYNKINTHYYNGIYAAFTGIVANILATIHASWPCVWSTVRNVNFFCWRVNCRTLSPTVSAYSECVLNADPSMTTVTGSPVRLNTADSPAAIRFADRLVTHRHAYRNSSQSMSDGSVTFSTPVRTVRTPSYDGLLSDSTSHKCLALSAYSVFMAVVVLPSNIAWLETISKTASRTNSAIYMPAIMDRRRPTDRGDYDIIIINIINCYIQLGLGE